MSSPSVTMRVLGVLSLFALLTSAAFLAGCGGTSTTAAPTTEATAAATTGPTASTGAGASSSAGGDPIVIGAVVSATGANAPLGGPQRDTFEILQKKINEAGGVIGRQIEIVVLDDQSSAKEAVTATNRLLQTEKAVAIIGASGSASTLAMKPIINKAGIPQIAMAAANAITDEAPIEWLWRVAPKDNLAVARALKYIAEDLKLTRVAVLHDENAFGSSGADEIQRTQGEWGLEVVALESYKTDETDLTAHLTKIAGVNPEVLVVWGTNPGPAVAAKNLQQLGLDIPYVGSHGIANDKFIELAGDAGEGVVLPTNKMVLPDSINDAAMKSIVDSFVADYKAAYGLAPTPFACYAHDGLLVLLKAIEAAGGTDPKALQEQLNKTGGLAAVGGIFTYTDTDHDGLKVDDLMMVRVKDGTWAPIE